MATKLILLFIAGAFLAAMDLLENEKFFISKFKNLNQKFWYKRESWKHAPRFLGYVVDAWHIAKSICFALVFLAMANLIVLDAIIYWTVFFTAFNLFYHKIFIKK